MKLIKKISSYSRYDKYKKYESVKNYGLSQQTRYVINKELRNSIKVKKESNNANKFENNKDILSGDNQSEFNIISPKRSCEDNIFGGRAKKLAKVKHNDDSNKNTVEHANIQGHPSIKTTTRSNVSILNKGTIVDNQSGRLNKAKVVDYERENGKSDLTNKNNGKDKNQDTRLNKARVVSKNNVYKNNYVLNKAVDKLEDTQKDENDSITNSSIRSVISLRKGSINSKSAIVNFKKNYYVIRNLNPKKAKQVKAAYLEHKAKNEIRSKKYNVYKHYNLKNLLADKLENNIIKNSKVDYSHTGDAGMEAVKMTIEKSYDAVKTAKVMVYQVKKAEKLFKTIKTNSNVTAYHKTNEVFKLKKQQTMAKQRYIKDFKKRQVLKKSSAATLNSAKNFSRVFNNIRKIEIIKFAATKLIIPVSVALLVFIIINMMSSAIVIGTTSYKMIVAEEKVILQYKNQVEKLDNALKNRIEKMAAKERPNYDDVVIDVYGDSGEISTSFKEILVLNTVLFEQDITYKQEEIDKIGQWYKKLNEVNTKTERYHCSGCETRYCSSKNCKGHSYCPGHTRLHIIVNCLSMEDILDDIEFTDFQKEWARELMLCDLEELYPKKGFEVEGGLSGVSGLSPLEVAQILSKLPETGAKRSEIVNSAVSLVGKVKYFWGGKSSAGWNDSWNTPRKVTSSGTSDSGTVIPYGMDCSGFVDWSYKTAGVGNVLSAGGTAYQWNQSIGISRQDAKPGDLVFKNPPSSNGINHVGIYLGKDKATGKDRFVHCSYSNGVTIDSWSGFKYFRRVKVKLDG